MENHSEQPTKYRPYLKLEYSTSDKILDSIGVLFLIILWITVLSNYNNLPSQIPIHFDASGKADNFGDKIFFLFIPIIATVLFIGISIFGRFPQKLNYPIYLHEGNVLNQYKNATQMLRIIKVVLAIVFTLITYQTTLSVQGNVNGLGSWLSLFIFVIIFAPVLYFTVKAYKLR